MDIRWSPKVGTWYRGRIGRPDFHTTQALTGHGCFRAFLKKINRGENEICWFGCINADGQPAEDDAEHTLFKCKRWSWERQEMKSVVGREVEDTPEGWSGVVLANKQNWRKFSDLYAGAL